MKKALLWVALTLIFPIPTFALNVPDYLIDADIGQYSRSYPGACPKGSGIIAAAGHFKVDHTDYACDIRYYNEAIDLGVEVQVTKHSDTRDSLKWLLHEVERGFRKGDLQELLTPARFRNIEGNNVFYTGLGGGTYRWLHNNILVNIEYTDLYKQKSEPIEVIKAYLRKFPSTVPVMTIDQAYNIKWIKDEMERRLWLGDKWFYYFQLKKIDEKQVYQEVVKSMNVFLDYREKYFGIKAADEKNLLDGYLMQNNGTGIKAKLKEYKDWWTLNKDKAITLP